MIQETCLCTVKDANFFKKGYCLMSRPINRYKVTESVVTDWV